MSEHLIVNNVIKALKKIGVPGDLRFDGSNIFDDHLEIYISLYLLEECEGVKIMAEDLYFTASDHQLFDDPEKIYYLFIEEITKSGYKVLFIKDCPTLVMYVYTFRTPFNHSFELKLMERYSIPPEYKFKNYLIKLEESPLKMVIDGKTITLYPIHDVYLYPTFTVKK